MLRQIGVGLVAGIAFLVSDAMLNANPLARRLYSAYEPIARPSVNAVAGSVVDLVYGLALTGLFVICRECLPGETNVARGVSFAVAVWFLRVVMRVAGEWVTTAVPASTHAYTLVAGFLQVLLVSLVIAMLLPESGGR